MAYVPRLLDRHLDSLLRHHPAMLLTGPRATGKTTTGARHAATVVSLDEPVQASAVEADPDQLLSGLPEPVLVDEWHLAPTVLGAIKRAVDRDPRPGRFLVTGSVRADLESAMWPGTGRLIRVPMYGMTVKELQGRLDSSCLLDRLAAGERPEAPADQLNVRDYVELALRGGFPDTATRLPAEERPRWFASYVDQLLTRDVDLLGETRDPARLRRYFEVYALNSAGSISDATLQDAAGVNHKTAAAYERLLVNLLVVERMPAWSSHRVARLTRAPKRYLVDPGLLIGIHPITADAVLRDGDLLGRLLDGFAVAQLRAELPMSEHLVRLYHLRTQQGRHEVDVIAELDADRVIGIEVKATSAPRASDATHLAWLRDELGERFVAGIVLNTGPYVFSLGERVIAAPISTLWS
ncbi:MAG: DUF4143 domain-containing protein [Acidimicrobiia bacterium]